MNQPLLHAQLYPHQQTTAKFWLLCWLALALLSFQTLGHLHRHAHGHVNGQSQGLGFSAAQAPSVDGWGHQSGDLSCQLFDQLSQDHAPGGQFALAAPAELALLPAAAPWASCSPAGHWKRGARGPPLWA